MKLGDRKSQKTAVESSGNADEHRVAGCMEGGVGSGGGAVDRGDGPKIGRFYA